LAVVLLFCWPRHTPRPARFPYPTLFRSPVGAEHVLGDLGAGQRGDGVGSGELHLLVDGSGPYVQRPPEDVREAEHVVDLVGEVRSEEHTSELQSRENLVCRLLLEKKKKK